MLYYFHEGRGEGVDYSMVMANKYNDPDAHLNVFLDFAIYYSNVYSKDIEISHLDSKTKNLALYYLVRANELEKSRKISNWVFETFKRDSIYHSSHYLMEIIKEDARQDTEREKAK